ncbi:hypothetical protein FI667_g6261, partial [Globisporangium splendens]
MLQQPLPPCDELDPLDAHLDDLEEPGTNFLQDFLVRPIDVPMTATPMSNVTDTPQSMMNGYTSEDTDYSVSTPSDEQMYQDMSFLQSADTDELVQVVADFEDLTALTPQQQQKFAGKVIKGKTSKYRGVTQTSKTSWGAKYSAKRITNTCKTPDEAAHAYDQYLKQHYPQKYSKFANFCERCGRFVNPLGLPEYKNECGCSDKSNKGGSPSSEHYPGDVTSPESSAAGSPPNPAEGEGIGYRASNLSVGSMKFSFSDDNEKFFDESFDMVAGMSADLDAGMQPAEPTYPGYEPPPLQKRDSIPLAVISSAVESFTKEDNLDQIIEDINRPSASSSFMKPQPVQNGEQGMKPDLQHSIEPTSTSSTYADFSMDELQDLSEYFLTDQFVPGESVNSAGSVKSTVSQHPPRSEKQSNYKKIHSLDFDTGDFTEDGIIKQESVADIDAMAALMHPSRPHAMAPSALSPFPAIIDIQTPFLEKYWRNDRKNIQCFPYCPEHGDYYRVRIEDLQHRCKGVCRAAVKVRITIPTSQPLNQQGLLVLARCNSTFSRNEVLTSQSYLNATEMKTLQSLSAVGVVDLFTPTADGVQFEVTFYPDVWKFEFDLPKKRRNISANSPMETEQDHLGSEFLYFFEIDVFYSPEKMSFQRLGHSESINFQIGNTRTLLRQRNKMAEDSTPTADSDRVLDADTLPEKKKVKMYRGQKEVTSSASISEEFDPSMIAKDKPTQSYITGEGISSSSKRGERIDPKKPMDVDNYFRMDSKDSMFDMEVGDGPPVLSPEAWKSQHDHETQSSNYNPYLSPKPKEVGVDTRTQAAAGMAHGGVAHRPQKDLQAPESYSLSKLFTYSLLCIPLSIVYVPIGFLLFVAFLVLPPLAPSVVRTLDALSDSDLRNANSSLISTDSRRELNRLQLDSEAGRGKMFRYHSNGAVWSRFVYFMGVKLIVSVVAFVPTLLLSLVSLLLFPIRPVSRGLMSAACSCALWTREYTRSSVGKPLTSAAVAAQREPKDPIEDLV